MSVSPKHNITADRATDLIMSGQSLVDVFVTGELKLIGLNNFDKSLFASNSIFEYLNAGSSQFTKLVKLSNCELWKCDFAFSYFLGGLEINNCVFENYLDFQAGGHNKDGNVVSIYNSTFKGFVNFFDCRYESEFIISENFFLKGTNLLGKPNGIPVTFDINPKIPNNKGKLDLDIEGDVGSTSVYLP
ncbi:MAG: hypothetical protein U0073_12130 [Bacteroidia bacterium]